MIVLMGLASSSDEARRDAPRYSEHRDRTSRTGFIAIARDPVP
jgi:hypothetical protein